jgi:hypothetical protein
MSDLRRLMGDLRYVKFSLKRSELYISVSYEGSRLGDEEFLECNCQFQCVVNQGRKESWGKVRCQYTTDFGCE